VIDARAILEAGEHAASDVRAVPTRCHVGVSQLATRNGDALRASSCNTAWACALGRLATCSYQRLSAGYSSVTGSLMPPAAKSNRIAHRFHDRSKTFLFYASLPHRHYRTSFGIAAK